MIRAELVFISEHLTPTTGEKKMIATAIYESSVKTAAGWRSVTVTAKVEIAENAKKCTVIDVIDIDGDGNSGYASRTGSKRQNYNLGYFAKAEIGKNKIVSKLQLLPA